MKKNDKARIMKRRKREKRFAKGAFQISAIAALVLFVLVIVIVEAAPSFLRPRIKDALAVRDFEKALRLSEYIGEEEVVMTEKQTRYIQAEDLLMNGEYDEAAQMFISLGSFQDAATRVMQAGYKKAEAALKEKRYSEAAELFALVGGYSNAMERRSECNYCLADQKYQQGELDEALKMFSQLGAYSDSAQRRVQIAIELTGIQDGELALMEATRMSPEELQMLSLLNEKRNDVKRGWLAVGYEHTAAKKADGTVVAAGDNTYGQTEVSGWSDVVYVDAGAYHTVALRSDGTVVAAGDNTHGQINVSGWSNVSAISAGAYDTYAVTFDGRLLHTGFSDASDIEGWSGLTAVSAGSYGVTALYQDGSMLSSVSDFVIHTDETLYETDVSTGYAVCVTLDGDAYATFGGIDWEHMAMISAGASGVLGIDANGNVLSHFFRESVSFDFHKSGAVTVAAGGAHHAVLYEDGTVKVYGENASGQADTENWQLF